MSNIDKVGVLKKTVLVLAGILGVAGGSKLYLDTKEEINTANERTTVLENQVGVLGEKEKSLTGKLLIQDQVAEAQKEELENANRNYKNVNDELAKQNLLVKELTKGVDAGAQRNKVLLLKVSELENFNLAEAKRPEVIRNAVKSTVTVTCLNGRQSSGSGFLVENLKGELAINTCGHFWNDANEFINSQLKITFPDGFSFQVMPRRMEDGTIPFSEFRQKDVALIRLDENNIKKIREKGISPLPLYSVLNEIKGGETIYVLGTPLGYKGSAAKGIVSALYKSPYFSNTTHYQTDAHINSGNSGGPMVMIVQDKISGKENAFTIGVNSWGENPRSYLYVHGIPSDEAQVSVVASTGVNFVVGHKDIARTVHFGFGWPILNNEEANALKREDVTKTIAIPIVSNATYFHNVVQVIAPLLTLEKRQLTE